MIYISGPISSPDPAEQAANIAAFHAAAAELRAAGREVFNPAENGLPAEAPWAEHMRADIRALMDCDVIHLLPGWWKSRGARLEHYVAVRLGMRTEGAPE